MIPGTILMDVTRLAARKLENRHPTGVDRVGLAYLRRYRTRSRALVRHGRRWLHLSGGASERLFSALLGESDRPLRDLKLAVASGHLASFRNCRDCLFLNLGHSGTELPQYARNLDRRGVRPVYFVHDLIPLTHPEYVREGEDRQHALRLATMAATARGLLYNSAATQEAVTRYLAGNGLRVPPGVAAPLGGENLPPPAAVAPLSEPYFLVLGTIEPRKNHLLLLHLWRRWAAEEGTGPVPRLVLAGRRGWECEQVVDLLDRSPSLKDRVLEIPACSDGELSTWLAHARALLFPSFAEGFGLPLVEALAFGVPVLASDLPVFRESAGPVPEYLDPLDGPGWQAALRDYAAGGPRREAQTGRIRSFRPWRWEDHFRLVESFFAGIADHA